jgi:DNA-binding NtrC family response regulator
VGVELQIPPLRERLDDLPLLAEHLLARFDAGEVRRGRSARAVTLSEDGLAELAGRPWPGNVRELENVLRLAWIRSPVGGAMGPRELGPAPSASGSESAASTGTLAEIEAAAIDRALAAAGGNGSAAARSLGIDRTTLHRKLRRDR